MKNKELVISSTREESQDSLIVRQPRYRCPRCDIELEPGISDGYCPRCAYDIHGTIDISEDLVDPQVQKDRAGAKEFATLMLMLDNWLKGYKKLIREEGVDWSLPHEFFQEFYELMTPYIARLRENGYATEDRMKAMGEKVVECLNDMIECIQQEEDVMRLTGQWTDKEEAIKLEWLEQMNITQRLIGC